MIGSRLRRWPRTLVRWLVAPARRAQRLLAVAACIAVVAMYCANTDMGGDPDTPRGDGHYRPVLARGDGHLLYLMARSTALDGDWQFDNDLARFGDPWRAPTTATGRKSIIHPIGVPLVWTPLIWIAEAGAAVVDGLGGDVPLHGYTLWHQRFVFLSSPLFACGAILLGRRLAGKLLGGSWAPTYAAVTTLLATSLLYYATYMPSYAHAIDSFACAAFLCYWAETTGRRDLRRWLVLGVLLGAATLVRTQELALGVVVALECVTGAVRAAAARSPRLAAGWIGGGAVVLAVAAVVMIPQLVEWQLVFGTVTELPQGARYTRLEAPMVAELLWSSRNGWFTTTPIAYLAAVGAVWFAVRARSIRASGLLAALAIQVYLNSTILDWWASSSFGQRRLCNVTIVLVVGLSYLLSRCNALAARWRGLHAKRVRLAIAAVILGGFIAFNAMRVWSLRAGAPAPAEIAPCCDAYPVPFRAPAQALDRYVGVPFEFPANAVFALWHGVDLQRWDRAVGEYPLVPPLDSLADDRLWHQTGRWRIGGGGFDRYIVDGLGPSRGDARRRYREITGASATVLVPNLMPYPERWKLSVLGRGHRVAVTWNGDDVAAGGDTGAGSDGWATLSFDLADPALHTNELGIRVEDGSGGSGGSGASAVAIGDLEVDLLGPP